MADPDPPKKYMASLAPSLLVSMPQLADPNFHKTVILLCEHGEEGAFGLVLNRPTTTPAAAVVRMSPPLAGGSELTLWFGGPVSPERGWILLGDEPREADSVRVCDGLFLSTSQDLLRRLLESPPPPRTRLLTGYAGWGPGQLDTELALSSWLNADVDLDLIFDTDPDQMWEAVIRSMGADPALLQTGGTAVN